MRRWDKLSADTQADLLFDLLSAFSLLHSRDDAAKFLTDFLTRDEVRFLSKRLRVAKLLLLGWKYREIETTLNVSHATIAKVAVWLEEKGDGFRETIRKIPSRKRHIEDRGGFKESHPAYFWPELVLDRWQKEKVRGEEDDLRKALETLDAKDVVNHRVQESFEDDFKSGKKRRT